MEDKIEIGDKVKCKVSKLEGVVTAVTSYLHGCDRLAIHYGLDRDGKPLDPLYIDEPQAELLNKQEVKRMASGSTPIKLGDKIKDPISGLDGIAFGRADFLYGCIRIAIAPKLDKEGKKRDIEWFDANQLEILKEKVVDSGNRRTGGPIPSIPTQNSNPRRD